MDDVVKSVRAVRESVRKSVRDVWVFLEVIIFCTRAGSVQTACKIENISTGFFKKSAPHPPPSAPSAPDEIQQQSATISNTKKRT